MKPGETTLHAARLDLPVVLSLSPDSEPISADRLSAFIESFLGEQCVCDGTLQGYRGGLRRFLAWLGETGDTLGLIVVESSSTFAV